MEDTKQVLLSQLLFIVFIVFILFYFSVEEHFCILQAVQVQMTLEAKLQRTFYQ